MASINTMLIEVVGKLSKKACFTLRVTILWKVPKRNSSEIARTIEMVLRDINVTGIQASIDRGERITRFKDSIVEHGICLMQNFIVCPNNGIWMPTSHTWMFCFIDSTVLSENVVVEYPHFSMDIYLFKTLTEVQEVPESDETPDLIDFIGALVQNEKVY